MKYIRYDADTQIVTVAIDKEMKTVDAYKEAAKLLLREVIRYEHGINPGFDW